MPRQKPTITFGPDLDLDKEVVYLGDERFTEETADRLAEHLENRDRSNDHIPARLANLIPGRKSLSGGGKHSPVVNVRVSETTRGRLEELAQERGVSVSRVAREAIDAYIAGTG